MPDTETPPRSRRRGNISRKKRLSKRSTGAKLWLPDQEIFDEFVGRRNVTHAELLREVVHEWATTKRVSGQAKDVMDAAGPIRKLHRDIISTELAPLRDTLSQILERLNRDSDPNVFATAHTSLITNDTQDSALLGLLQNLADELKATKEELAQLRLFASAHYLLSGQTFAATWATLNFLQTYIIEPILRRDPKHAKDSELTAIEVRDSGRKEGLTMVRQMDTEFNYPQTYEPVLIVPEGQA